MKWSRILISKCFLLLPKSQGKIAKSHFRDIVAVLTSKNTDSQRNTKMQIPVKTRQAVLAPISSRRSVGNHRSLSSKFCDFSTCRTHKRFTSDYQSISRIFIVLPLLVPCYKMEYSTKNRNTTFNRLQLRVVT